MLIQITKRIRIHTCMYTHSKTLRVVIVIIKCCGKYRKKPKADRSATAYQFYATYKNACRNNFTYPYALNVFNGLCGYIDEKNSNSLRTHTLASMHILARCVRYFPLWQSKSKRIQAAHISARHLRSYTHVCLCTYISQSLSSILCSLLCTFVVSILQLKYDALCCVN